MTAGGECGFCPETGPTPRGRADYRGPG